MPSTVKKITKTVRKSVAKKAVVSAAVSSRVKSVRVKPVVPANLPTVSALEPVIFGGKSESKVEVAPSRVELAMSAAPVAMTARHDAPYAFTAPVSAPKAYPNTTKINLPSPHEKSIIKSVRAGFYLGVMVGMIMVSLLVSIAYFSLLSSAYASTGF